MPKVFIWPAILVTAAILAAAALLLLLSPPNREAAARAPVEVDAPPTPARISPTTNFDQTPPAYSTGAPAVSQPSQPTMMPLEAPTAPWEISINRLLDSEDGNDKVAAGLAALLPTLPLEGQLEAVQHMVNLLDDEQYQLATRLLLDPALHPDLREVIFSDVVDRSNSIRLPALLTLLGTPGHPLQGEARRVLQEAVGSDFGHNPAGWQAAAQVLVDQEAAEEAEVEREDSDEDP